MPSNLPTEWTDEFTGFESLLADNVSGWYACARLGCEVFTWKDDPRPTWITKRADGTILNGRSDSLVLAFQDAEMATGRFITIPAGPFA